LLALDGFLGLAGWQWLFLAEGLPAAVFGVWLGCTLAEAPATAAFLAPQERAWLTDRNEAHKARIWNVLMGFSDSISEQDWRTCGCGSAPGSCSRTMPTGRPFLKSIHQGVLNITPRRNISPRSRNDIGLRVGKVHAWA